MLLDDPQKREYYLWRLMIGGPFQGRGFGRAVIELLVEHVRQRPGATRLTTSCVQGEGSPEGFYQRLSFVSDGQMYGEELDLALELPEIPTRPLSHPRIYPSMRRSIVIIGTVRRPNGQNGDARTGTRKSRRGASGAF